MSLCGCFARRPHSSQNPHLSLPRSVFHRSGHVFYRHGGIYAVLVNRSITSVCRSCSERSTTWRMRGRAAIQFVASPSRKPGFGSDHHLPAERLQCFFPAGASLAPQNRLRPYQKTPSSTCFMDQRMARLTERGAITKTYSHTSEADFETSSPPRLDSFFITYFYDSQLLAEIIFERKIP